MFEVGIHYFLSIEEKIRTSHFVQHVSNLDADEFVDKRCVYFVVVKKVP